MEMIDKQSKEDAFSAVRNVRDQRLRETPSDPCSGIPVEPSKVVRQLKFYYSKRPVDPMNSRSASGRQSLPISDSSHANSCNGQFEVDAFYEIDPSELPPKSPSQLKASRVVKVLEATKLEVTVRFPSILSLRNYFALCPEPGHEPELDEQYVMSSNQAMRVLRRLVPAEEVDDEKNMQSFWVMKTELLTVQNSGGSMAARTSGMKWKAKSSVVSVNQSGLSGWGVRRKVKYIARHRELALALPQPSPLASKKDEDLDVVEENTKSLHAEQTDEMKTPEVKSKKRKRSSEGEKKKHKKNNNKKKNYNTRTSSDHQLELRSSQEELKERGSRERWSTERYEAAETRLLRIMKESKAELGRPMKRQVLREEARKEIGDTGLLDHLLKHMNGRVVLNGKMRFRRKHNSEGHMEYWLEPAELAEVRTKAGVLDPYWAPPPGWKPGQGGEFFCACGGECKEQMKQLKDEITLLKSNIVELTRSLKNKVDDVSKIWQDNYKILSEQNGKLKVKIADLSDFVEGLQEKYQKLVEHNAKLGEKIATVPFQAIKEDIKVLKSEKDNATEEKEKLKPQQEAADHCNKITIHNDADKKVNPNSNTTTTTTITRTYIESTININSSNLSSIPPVLPNDNPTRTTSNKNKNNSSSSNPHSAGSCSRTVRRSGFRICKPQGSFLWPDMRSSSPDLVQQLPLLSSGSRRPQLGGLMVPSSSSRAVTAYTHDEQLMLFGMPTPPSASSATSSPRMLIIPSPTSPVLPRRSQICLPVETRSQTLAMVTSPSCIGGNLGSGTCEREMSMTDLALATPSNFRH